MQTKKWGIKVAILCLCLGVPSTCPAKVIHVDGDAAGANNGTNWNDAFTDLQEAMSNARAFPQIVEELRVAHGVYRPARPSGHRQAAFQLIDGLVMKGGYAGGDPVDVVHLDEPPLVSISSTMARPIASPMSM